MKKLLVVYNFKGQSEFEWLLPILDQLKNKYYIFTIFRNKAAFNSVKNNKKMFTTWRKINQGKYIEKRVEFFLIKLLIIIIKKFSINNFLINFLRKKIYNTQRLKKIIQAETSIKNLEIDFFFSEFGFSSGWVDFLKKEKIVKIIHYPSTPQIYTEPPDSNYSLRGDALFLNSFLDTKFFSTKIKKNKIFVTGNPKYDPLWIKKNYEIENTNNKIVVAYVSKFDYEEDWYKRKLEKQLIDLIRILNTLNKSVIFKIHPTKNSKYYKVILKKHAKFKWHESKKNLIEITQNCLCLITHPYSAAGFDSFINSTPVLQLWPIIEREFNIITSYEKLKLIIKTKTIKDFEKKIRILVKKNKKNFQNLKTDKFYPQKKDTIKRILNLLNTI